MLRCMHWQLLRSTYLIRHDVRRVQEHRRRRELERRQPDLTHSYVRALAIDPADPDHALCGDVRGGVFKSTDGGGSWSAVNTGLTSYHMSTPWPSTPRPRPRSTRGQHGGGVFKSTERRRQLERRQHRPDRLPMFDALAIDPRDPDHPLCGDIRAAACSRAPTAAGAGAPSTPA